MISPLIRAAPPLRRPPPRTYLTSRPPPRRCSALPEAVCEIANRIASQQGCLFGYGAVVRRSGTAFRFVGGLKLMRASSASVGLLTQANESNDRSRNCSVLNQFLVLYTNIRKFKLQKLKVRTHTKKK
jgi:hypothetical protein